MDDISLTDELMTMGFRPHEDTVIVRVEVKDDKTPNYSDSPIAPMFDHIVLEIVHHEIVDGRLSPQIGIFYMERIRGNFDHDRAYALSFLSVAKCENGCCSDYSYVDSTLLFQLTDDGYLHNFRYGLSLNPSFYFCRYLRSTSQPTERVGDEYLSTAHHWLMWLFQKLAIEKSETELITYPRAAQRRIKRKIGKDPSPYVSINLNPQQSQRDGSKSYHAIGRKQPLHRVRGHFRRVENHPRIPDGVYYITPHLRGDKAQGDRRRDYRVVLPSDAQTDS